MRPGDPPLYVLIDAFQEVWTSTDGTEWTKVTTLDSAMSGIDSTNRLLVLGDRFVALDRSWLYDLDPREEFDGPYRGVIGGQTWVSADARSWSSHATPVAFRGGIVDGDRLIGIGGVRRQFSPTFAASSDGADWTLVGPSGDPWPSETDAIWYWVDGLAGDKAAGFVVSAMLENVGGTSCSGPGITPPLPTPAGYSSPVPIIWRSTDLATWTPVATAVLGCGRMEATAHGPNGFVAVGWGSTSPDDDAMRTWFSRDGVDWHEGSDPPTADGRNVEVTVAPDGTYLTLRDEMWESIDGDHWFLSAPVTNAWVLDFAGDLAIACGRDRCFALRLAAS
jgi:hypothetical protein